MKFSRPAAVLGAVIVLVGGVTMAVHAATASTDSPRLCIQKNASVGSVYAPGAGVTTCQKGFKLVELASADAVQALQAQVDQLASHVNQLDPGEFTATGAWFNGNAWIARFNGQDLEPGADVVVTHGIGVGDVVAHVGANGELSNVQGSDISVCHELPYTFATTTAWGNPISSTVSSVSGC